MKIKKDEFFKIIDKFCEKKIAVIGDVILDKYIFGKVRRISPEAPVPVVEISSQKYSFGGAGNVVNNISELGAETYLVSVIGEDNSGDELISMIETKKGINYSFIIRDKNQKTIEKTRVIAEHQQVVRIDREIKYIYSKKIKEKMEENIKSLIKTGIDSIILSDYGKGILSKEIIEFTVKLANKNKIPIFVDPKIEHFMSYKKVTSMTPNVMEAYGGMRKLEDKKQKSIEKLGVEIIKKLKLKSLVITQSEDGMTVFDAFTNNIKITHIPTKAIEVFDVTGAGDTVISVLALGYSVSNDILKSAILANYAAGIVVGKLGTATVSPQELKTIITNQ